MASLIQNASFFSHHHPLLLFIYYSHTLPSYTRIPRKVSVVKHKKNEERHKKFFISIFTQFIYSFFVCCLLSSFTHKKYCLLHASFLQTFIKSATQTHTQRKSLLLSLLFAHWIEDTYIAFSRIWGSIWGNSSSKRRHGK